MSKPRIKLIDRRKEWEERRRITAANVFNLTGINLLKHPSNKQIDIIEKARRSSRNMTEFYLTLSHDLFR